MKLQPNDSQLFDDKTKHMSHLKWTTILSNRIRLKDLKIEVPKARVIGTHHKPTITYYSKCSKEGVILQHATF